MEQEQSKITNKFFQDISFIELVVAVVIGWMLVDIWIKVIENLAYQKIGLNEKSVYHSFVVAMTVTLIFIVLVFLFQDISGSIAKQGVSESFLPFGKGDNEFMWKIASVI